MREGEKEEREKEKEKEGMQLLQGKQKREKNGRVEEYTWKIEREKRKEVQIKKKRDEHYSSDQRRFTAE